MTNKINNLEFQQERPKKRVLFIITQSEFGGAQHFLYTLVNRLDKNKYDICVAAGPNFSSKSKILSSKSPVDLGPLPDIKYDLLDLLEKDKIETVHLKHLLRGINPWHDFLASLELRRIVKKWQPDTIFLNSSKVGFLGSFVAKYLILHSKYKILYRIGGWSFNDPWPKWKKWLWIIIEWFSARWKDYIIVNNKHDFEQAHKLQIKPREKIVIVYNGLDVYKTEFLPKEEARLKLYERAARQSGKIFQGKTIIGTIANFYPPKGLKYLIEAAEHFKNRDDVVFIIIGDGQERKDIELLITNCQLQHKVLLLGQIPDAYKYLPAFDIFVLPSVKEGFPWVVIEAMTAKLPVIATKVGAVPEIIEDGKNGMLVEPARPEQIAIKIQELLNNDHLKQEIGIQAHQTVLFKFSLDKMIRETEDLL
jgi:glycosyltransferase involved in cell wall biosynthesis